MFEPWTVETKAGGFSVSTHRFGFRGGMCPTPSAPTACLRETWPQSERSDWTMGAGLRRGQVQAST